MYVLKIFLLLFLLIIFVIDYSLTRTGSLVRYCLIKLNKSNYLSLDSKNGDNNGDSDKKNEQEDFALGNGNITLEPNSVLINFDYLNVTSTIDQSSESFTSFDGSSLFEDHFEDRDKMKESKDSTNNKTKHKGLSIQEQLSTDLLALGVQAVLKRKYNLIRFSDQFSFESMSKCLFEDNLSQLDKYNITIEIDYRPKFVDCCIEYVPTVIGKNCMKKLNKLNFENYIRDFCTDLRIILEEMGIAFRIPFKWLPSASEKLTYLSKLKISGSKNLVNNKKYCHPPRKTLDIVFDVDQTLLTMVPVFEVTPGEKSILLEMLEIPPELKDKRKDFNFHIRRASDNTLRYNIPHEVHLNPQTIGLLFSLYYRKFLDPCVGSMTIFSAGFNTILKFSNSVDIEPILSPSRFHLSDTLIELFPDDNEVLWATERPALLASKENRISTVQLPPLRISEFEKRAETDKTQKLIRSFSEGFHELVYNGLPLLVKDMQRYRLHITLQKGNSSLDYKSLSGDLDLYFLNTLRFYQTLKRYPVPTHPFNSPKLFSNNRPLSLLVDDELLHFTYACSTEAWSDNILIAWTEKLGPKEIISSFSKYYLPIPLQHNLPKPIKMGEFSRNLNMMMNLDYFEGLTYQISQLKSLNTSKVSSDKEKHSKSSEELKDMEQFLSSINENDLDWSGNLYGHRDDIFNLNGTDISNSITPNKLLQLVYPDVNSSNMFSCPYDISNIKLFYIAIIIPCEFLFILHLKLKNLMEIYKSKERTGIEKENLYKLIKMVDMFVVTNERKDELCDHFVSSLSGVIAFKNYDTLFNKKVIYSAIPSLPVLKSVIGLPMYRTITIWIQSSNIFGEFLAIKTEMEEEINSMQNLLKNTTYEPLPNSRQFQNGIIYDKSIFDIENLIIIEPIKSNFSQEINKYNSIEQIENIIDIVKLFGTIRSSLEISFRDVRKRVNLEDPNIVTSQGAINVLIYSICFGIAIEQYKVFHLSICNTGRPVFSRPILRRNQMDWLRFALKKILTELNIKLSFPITRSFERKFQHSIYVSNSKPFTVSSSLFQPYFTGTQYKPIKHEFEDEILLDKTYEEISAKTQKDIKDIVKKNLLLLHDDLLEYIVNSLSSLDYQPFFVRQCLIVTTSLIRFQVSLADEEKNNGAIKPSNDELANLVCQSIQTYLLEQVPEFFKL